MDGRKNVMLLKVKKTSEKVDAIITTENGKAYATYFTKGTNQGKGGWVTTKISALVPIDVKTENEIRSDQTVAEQKERENMYRKMFDECEHRDKEE